MAKIGLTKLGLNKEKIDSYTTLDFYNEIIQIKLYLPIEEKLNLISSVINQSVDNNGYYNPVKIKIYKELAIIEFYTNINFTAKQKENIYQLYDLLKANNVFNNVFELIPVEELNLIDTSINKTIKSIYTYKNSFSGMLENITQDFSNLNFDAEDIQKKLGDPNNIALLRDIMTKLG